jgi:hypothetical protein
MENTLVPQPVDTNTIYNQAANLLIEQQVSPEQAIDTMVANGIPEDQARAAVEDLRGQITNVRKKQAQKDILWGAVWCVGGTIATAANIGFIFWGAIVFGGIQLIKGLINYSKAE